MVSNCGITKILHAIVHGGCPSHTAGNILRGGANINVNIFVNILPMLNIVVSLGCYLTYLLELCITLRVLVLSLQLQLENKNNKQNIRTVFRTEA